MLTIKETEDCRFIPGRGWTLYVKLEDYPDIKYYDHLNYRGEQYKIAGSGLVSGLMYPPKLNGSIEIYIEREGI